MKNVSQTTQCTGADRPEMIMSRRPRTADLTVKGQICSDRQCPIMRKTEFAILLLEAGRPRLFPRE